MADSRPYFTTLSLLVLGAGLLIWLIPVVSNPIIIFLVNMGLGSRLTPLIASVAIFLLPSMLMGMVSPYSVRLRATDIARMGNVSGGLYAISAGGSILGTLLTAFILIPFLRVRIIFLCLGAVLVALSSLGWRFKTLLRIPVVIGAIAAVALGYPHIPQPRIITPEGSQIIYERDSAYHRIFVTESNESRYLRFDSTWQSGMSLTDPDESVFSYTDFFQLSWIFNPDIKNILIVGLGGGSAPKKFYTDFPEVIIDVAEIDPVVVKVAEDYFHLPQDERIRVSAEDGRTYLARSDSKYDLIVLDAFFGQSVPFHLMTEEFLDLTRDHLTDKGVVMANIIGSFYGREGRLFRSLYKTSVGVFPEVLLFMEDYYGGDEEDYSGNIILVALKNPVGLTKDQIVETAAKLKDERVKVPLLDVYAQRLYQGQLSIDDVPILTDDYAPVDALKHL